MDLNCTCGAPLPPNARFCPQCGRPTGEPPAPEVAAPAEPQETLPQPAAEPIPIGFGNSAAIRAAWLGSLVAALLGNIPFLNFLCFVWYPAAGFLTVYTYRKRTGETPSVRGGAKLGWITGIFTFTIGLVLLLVATLLPNEGDGGGLAEGFRRSIRNTPMQEDVRRQMLDMLDNPAAVGAILLFALLTSFLVTVGFTTTGGAIGAKVLEED